MHTLRVHGHVAPVCGKLTSPHLTFADSTFTLVHQEELFQNAFEPLGIQRNQFRTLLEYAEWHAVSEESEPQVVCVEGTPLTQLHVSLEGSMGVIKGGVPVASLAPYQLMGEVALLENLRDDATPFAARATLVAEPGARYVSWTQASWYAPVDPTSYMLPFYMLPI